jgi:DNA-binding transcriptional MerR regulator
MRYFTIKDLERLTGIKAHTIRIWEQRYQLLTPERTDTNFRSYSDVELKHLLNVSNLIKNGHKISKVSKYSSKQINTFIKEIENSSNPDTSKQVWIDNIIQACITFDEISFEMTFSHCVTKIGFDSTLMDLIYPALNKIGVLWGLDEVSPAQEHFITNLIRKKILVAIDGMMPDLHHNKSTYLLFLPQWEEHDLGLLYAYYLLRKSGYNVIYLGTTVPYENLSDIDSSKFEGIVTFFIINDQDNNVPEFLSKLASDFSDKKIFFSAGDYLLNNAELPGTLNRLIHPNDLTDSLNKK